MRMAILFLLGALTFSMSGCVTKGAHKKEMNMVQGQIGALSQEVSRIDTSLRETDAALKDEEAKHKNLETELAASRGRIGSLKEERGVLSGGKYRTPSGFELPSMSIQNALKSAGYYNGTIDGKIGPSTRSAIRDFQSAHGLAVDGICGRKTWEKLKTYLDTGK